MLTDDERSSVDNKHIDEQGFVPPNWQEVEDLLDFAERLKLKCDDLSDKIFVWDVYQMFSVVFIILIISARNFIYHSYISFTREGFESNFLIIIVSFLLVDVVLLIFSEAILRQLRRKILTDLSALNSIIDLLRENYSLLTQNFSELQKIQLKIKLSRFDIEIAKPTSLYDKLINLVYILLPFLRIYHRKSNNLNPGSSSKTTNLR